MKLAKTLVGMALAISAGLNGQQSAPQQLFYITGTPIPAELLKVNYGSLPKGINAYDLSICNVSSQRHSLVSSAIFQALAEADNTLQPVGRQIMLAAILRNQNHSVQAILNMALGSTTSTLSVLNTGPITAATGWKSGLALGALVAQQILSNWKPALTADQVEKFESQVLEPALVMDAGSCVERTVFTVTVVPSKKPQALQFHVR